MKAAKIVIAGGTGFIGQELIKYFGKENNIVVLTRKLPVANNNRNSYNSLAPAELNNVRFIKWDGKTVGNWANELEGADLIINLAGKSVNCRYNRENKKEILESRVNAVNVIGEAIKKCSRPPACWINASSATIYRHSIDKPQDEYNKDFQNGFSVDVCLAWENAFQNQQTPNTRKIALRMAITLGSGGVLIPYFNLLKMGLGGKQGSGKQMYSWVHITDTCRMIEWIAENKNVEGIFNCASTNPVTNKFFMQTLRKVTGYKIGLPAYAWMLKIGALIIGTESELVLKSRWVLPTKITAAGFQFNYPKLEEALTEIISHVPRKQYRLF